MYNLEDDTLPKDTPLSGSAMNTARLCWQLKRSRDLHVLVPPVSEGLGSYKAVGPMWLLERWDGRRPGEPRVSVPVCT